MSRSVSYCGFVSVTHFDLTKIMFTSFTQNMGCHYPGCLYLDGLGINLKKWTLGGVRSGSSGQNEVSEFSLV